MTLAADASPERGQPTYFSERNAEIATFFDARAHERVRWLRRNRYYHQKDLEYLRFLIPKGSRVLELGCGTGYLLAGLEPSYGVGLDFSGEMIKRARVEHPDAHLQFQAVDVEAEGELESIGETFDVVLISDTIGYFDDVLGFFQKLKPVLNPNTRVIVSYYSRLWNPLLQIVTMLGLRMPTPAPSWLATADIAGMMELGDLQPIRREWRQLIPHHLFGLGILINRYIAPIPGIRRLCLRNYVVARPAPIGLKAVQQPSASVLIPCRNERGNIEAAVQRLPSFGSHQEIIFIEGHSQDGTYEECLRVRDAYPDRDIRVLKQTGRGKGDAMRLGFAEARGDIVMILDSDLSVAPEAMPQFYRVLADRRGEFVNGTRLIYPRETDAMRWINYVGNRLFAQIFSYLLNQRLTDTLCGTKCMWRVDYQRLAANRSYFGDFDPFGDFDMLLGAAKLNLKIVELPVRYFARRYGETQISRFRDGFLLARMSVFAWRKLKAF